MYPKESTSHFPSFLSAQSEPSVIIPTLQIGETEAKWPAGSGSRRAPHPSACKRTHVPGQEESGNAQGSPRNTLIPDDDPLLIASVF